MIYSPDFPDSYAAGRVCYWTIQVPGSSAILFNFTFFDISDQTDMVELLNGYTNQVVARFDWRSPPRELVNVTGDFVILYFFSDRTNQAQGFALLYLGRVLPSCHPSAMVTILGCLSIIVNVISQECCERYSSNFARLCSLTQ